MVKVRFLIGMNEDVRTAMDFTKSNITYGGVNFTNLITKKIPSLKNIVGKPDKERKLTIEKEMKNSYKKEMKRLVTSKKRFVKFVENFNFNAVEKYIGKKINSCYAYISIFDCNPVYPDEKKFQIYYKATSSKVLKTIVHEFIHILYDNCNFTLLKHLPKDKQWMLSEIVDELIMEKFGLAQGGYPEHRKYLSIFRKIMKDKGDFKSFVKTSALEVLKL